MYYNILKMFDINKNEIDSIIGLLETAGQEIIKVYRHNDFGTFLKEDRSPVTRADLISDYIVKEGLKELTPEIPVFSEETIDTGNYLRLERNTLWILDPLDGTKEFIARNDEFCISLALITDGKPVAGFIHAPVFKKTWFAVRGKGTWMLVAGEKTRVPAFKPDGPYRILRSRSHHSQAEESWLKKISLMYETEIITKGSAIKFCEIAEGYADLYLKSSLINEWDVAAGHIIVEEAGGGIIEIATGKPPVYNKKDYHQHPFITYGVRGEKILNDILQILKIGRRD
ncbi:MAG TPA: 3'(2'),5'-bisphosphate nucleotidase CysQ [Bacteroidales bacterium]|nr:3'(2'),5'-bisphosphate nucleotidase CysQ [Bacteroidales bacterium]HRT47952.1 3'(2'),5'-bisphosphate nucleotidase CysQ [Bacteroidales bacterium]